MTAPRGQVAHSSSARSSLLTRFRDATARWVLCESVEYCRHSTLVQGLDGVVFYSLQQLRYGEKFNYTLLCDILALGLEVLFEGVSIRTRDKLAE